MIRTFQRGEGIVGIAGRIGAGDAYVADTGVKTLSGLLLNMKTTLQNPIGSGKVLHVYEINFISPLALLLSMSVLGNPLNNKPSSSSGTSVTNLNPESGKASAAIIKASNELLPMTGGAALETLAIPAGSKSFDVNYTLSQGDIFGLNVGGIVGLGMDIMIKFWEETIQ